MMRLLAIAAAAALSLLSTLTVGRTIPAHRHADPAAAEARQVVVEFFRSQNERQYDRTCGLLSRRFYAEHRLPDKPTCVALLRVGFMWGGQIKFQISRIDGDGERFIVWAIANGAPGRIVLERDGGSLKILGVRGDESAGATQVPLVAV